jgi:PAS domain S-box-containing protein
MASARDATVTLDIQMAYSAGASTAESLLRVLSGSHGPDAPFDFLDRLPIGVYLCDRDGLIVRFNRRAVELWGRAPMIGDPAERYCGSIRLRLPTGALLPRSECPVVDVLRTGVAVRSQEVVVERPDGSRVTVMVDIDAVRDEAGEIVGAINCFRDVTDFRRRGDAAHALIVADNARLLHESEAELSESRRSEVAAQRLAAIVESSDDAIVAKNLDGIIRSWNAGAERLFGYTAEEAIGKPITMLIPEERLDEETTILARIRAGERVDHYETVRRRKDGSPIEISLTVSPVRDAAGRIIGASKIARDITERRRAERQQKLLLQEMNHRVKNLFSLASSVVALSARSAKSTEDMASAVSDRLRALARAHALTLPAVSDGDHGAEGSIGLHALVRTIVSPYEERGDGDVARLTISGPDVAIANSSVTSLALLLHEFATNAAKYGALSTPGGQIQLDCTEEGEWLVLTWRERGGPVITGPREEEGFGSRLARATVKGQFGGEIVRKWRPEGLLIRLTVERSRLTD